MSPSPIYGRSRDKNEKEIVQALEKLGWLVRRHEIYDLDICCPRCKAILAIEVKMPKKKYDSGGYLTKRQLELIEAGWPLQVVRSVSEAVTCVRWHQNRCHFVVEDAVTLAQKHQIKNDPEEKYCD